MGYMSKLSREELAWAAGFFDGDGSICCYLRKPTRPGTRLILSIGQRDRAAIDRFDNATMNVGRVRGPYQRKTGGPLYFYRAQGPIAFAVISMIWTWLSPVKRTQTQDALGRWVNHGLYVEQEN